MTPTRDSSWVKRDLLPIPALRRRAQRLSLNRTFAINVKPNERRKRIRLRNPFVIKMARAWDRRQLDAHDQVPRASSVEPPTKVRHTLVYSWGYDLALNPRRAGSARTASRA
jgi:hypothetical protein